uniref:RNA helicase n=1 Tax=Lotharella globosa TaxID=91324 RepID=A0A6V3S0D1_9EUKA|mmetsp:Transcript_2951/g.5629  ORF Transcript_2951/g.5629 Transcript_2951/m.5629 type:complete len:1058 (+) Transcript_2951:70-3243(+)
MSLKRWVSDGLQKLMGFSDGTTADYLIAMASKAKSSQGLVRELEKLDIKKDSQLVKFASELYSKAPRKRAAAPSRSYQRAEREKMALLRQNQSYSMLDDDSDEEEQLAARKRKKAAKKQKKQLKKRKRQMREKKVSYSDDEDSSEDEAPQAAPPSSKGGEDEKEDADVARERDLRERDEFAERLKKKDEERTKKTGDSENKKALEALDEEEKEKLLPKLRWLSRVSYLGKREKEQIEYLKRVINDEEYLFKNEKLSKREMARHQMNKKLLDIIQKRINLSDHVDGYNMPEAYVKDDGTIDKEKREAALNARFQEEKKGPSEQEEWEDHQIMKSRAKFGARDKKKKDDYEFVFEDQIDFIQTQVIKGRKSKAKIPDKEEIDPKLSEREKMKKVRESLPIFPYREQLLDAVRQYQVLIIEAETGAGKTTQVPQYLFEAGYAKKGIIGCTQPRRVAAMSVAARVAEEMGTKLGHEVGYSIRFEDCTSDSTRLKYMTDGMLLREFLGEPDLSSYSVMMIDEAHERTLHTDVLFGLIKDIARFREDIKILISSATLNATKFSNYFDEAPVFKIPGRRYPVDIFYTKAPEADYIDASIVTVLQIHVTQPLGDILVFLTGQEEIEAAQENLERRVRGLGTKIGELMVLPIYSTLPSDMQAKIFEPTPPGARKVVLATNIAETSLTINGVIYVIDPGFCKQKSYNPRSGMEALIVTPVSRASAQQRAGRAGRVAAGKCFRLYTAHAFMHELEEDQIPEIQRTNLGNVVLMLKSLGINDLIHFDFLDPPPAETLIRALELLYALGALNDRGELTKLGRRMAELPLDPMLSKMLIQSEEYGCSEECLTICAMLSAGNAIFYRPKDKAVHADNAHKNFWKPGGDHLTLLNVYTQWVESNYSVEWCYTQFLQARTMKRARDVREQIEGMMDRVEVEMKSTDDHAKIRKAIASGFFYNTARLSSEGVYKTVKHNLTVLVHPSSCLHKELKRWLIYFELVLTNKEYMRQVIEIDPKWLVEIAPHYYKKKEILDSTQVKMPKKKGRAGGDAKTWEEARSKMFESDVARHAYS